VAGTEEEVVHPVIMTEVAAQHILDLQAEAAQTAKAQTAKARTVKARTAREGRLAWLFDLADRRGAARAAQHSPDFCCPDYLLTGQCAVHAEAHRMAAGSGGPS
jgi:hypothetical protein